MVLVWVYLSDAPVVEEHEPTVYSGIGEAAILECRVKSHPVPKVTWHHNENDSPVDPMRLKRARKDKEDMWVTTTKIRVTWKFLISK